MIGRAVRKHYPGVRVESFDNLHAVAKGAAIYAGRDRSGVAIGNVLSKTFGIRVSDSTGAAAVSNIIFRDCRLPCSASKRFHPMEGGQVFTEIEVFENDASEGEQHTAVADSQRIGSFSLEFPPDIPADAVV